LRSLSGGGFRHTPRLGAGKLDQDVPVANARLLHKRIHGSTIHIYGDAAFAEELVGPEQVVQLSEPDRASLN
jgi:hypothetical protein